MDYKYITTVILLMMFSYTYAQNNTSFSATFRNTYQYCEESENKSYVDCVLDISDGQSHFYNISFERGQDLTDSLLRKGLSAMEVRSEKVREGLTGLGETTNVFKNYPSKNRITVTENIGHIFLYEEEMPQYDWQLADNDTLLLGYKCFEAKTEYRGRVWRVFYTPELAVSDGPWKLCGLPGLIMYAEDEQGQFRYECIALENNIKRPIALRKGQKQKCSAKEMSEMLTLQGKDLDEMMFRLTGTRMKHIDPKGNPTKLNMSFTVCLKEKFPKKDFR